MQNISAYEKIVIFGNTGSGKTTLALELGSILGLPVVHLDRLSWRSGWVRVSACEQLDLVGQVVKDTKWIIDGAYGPAQELIFSHTQLVIFLDFPSWLCAWRVCKRWYLNRGQTRLDLHQECCDYFSLRLILTTLTYPRYKLLQSLKQMPQQAFLIGLQQGEISKFLGRLTLQ